MKKSDLRDLAQERMARVEVQVMPGTGRWNVTDGLAKQGNIGMELGVAAGGFATRAVQSGRFAAYFGVDVYGDLHNVREYRKALLSVGLLSEFRLLRMTFDQALELFPDDFFDFIYADGYAHTGEEGGRTLTSWYPKLKPGGIMAGDDYSLDDWPLVVWAVNDFVAQIGCPLRVTGTVSEEAYSRFPSWWITKPETGPLPVVTPELVAIADAQKEVVARQRKRKMQARRAAATSSTAHK